MRDAAKAAAVEGSKAGATSRGADEKTDGAAMVGSKQLGGASMGHRQLAPCVRAMCRMLELTSRFRKCLWIDIIQLVSGRVPSLKSVSWK